MKRSKFSIYILPLLLILGITIGSCTRRDLDMPEEGGEVSILFDWSLLAKGDTIPKNMKLYFYAANGTIIEKTATREGFRGMMPKGGYRILTHNPDAGQVDYKKMNSYKEATVFAPGYTKASYIEQPLYSYGAGLDTFTVVISAKNEATIRPVPFVKKATLKLALTGSVSAINTCNCSLNGIVQAVRIAHAEAENTAGTILFSPKPVTGGYESTISFFGKDQPSTNMLGIIFDFKAGGGQTLDVDITSALSTLSTENPWLEIKLNIEITGSAEGVFKATLKDWTVEEKEIVVT